MGDDVYSELNALNDVISALQRIGENESRKRVLQTAATFFGVQGFTSGESTRSNSEMPLDAREGRETSFSQDRTISPKEFIMQKQPQTDIERVACLAYYLTHYQDAPYFKTLDISKLNVEAAQPKFTNAAVAVNNAMLRNYLAPGTKGNKQLSAQGERFVQALPDREAARTAMAAARPKRRKRITQENKATDEESGSN